ncbi:hypothetical protein SK803_21555 [Lentzea sp. BCCO 10_0856]|uniref:Uncharacterized protein n=1 Tax=Lentzea miocenica TaxID=3095431 RepID=A0ABU4T3S6_9PSEU|nr:hypothetical protein [Lentzea sp. BCCO 10_0856]MDX8032811.1 hypothetical protein [Lentzea sp. BCCO 10_0856]
MRSRVLVYFGSLLATIALINTPVPRIVVSAVLNPEAGDAVARSLGSVTKDLVLVLLISIYFEWVRTKGQGELLRGMDRKLDALRDEAAPAIKKLVLDTTSPEELITTALDRHIPRTADKSTFMSLLLSTRPVHHDASMTHTTALSDACPELFDVATLTTETSFEEEAKSFGEKLECYVEPRSGVTRRVEFRKVATNSVRRYISPPVGMTQGDLVLFLADLSREEDEFVRVRQHLRWSQDIAEHFSWWYADRPMFVRTLTMDMRELVRNQGLKVFVQVFLGSVENLMLDAEDGYLSLRLDRWVVQGQGAVAVW